MVSMIMRKGCGGGLEERKERRARRWGRVGVVWW
jgi:hypothetical protein